MKKHNKKFQELNKKVENICGMDIAGLAFPTAKKMKEVVWKRYQQAMEQWLVEVVKP